MRRTVIAITLLAALLAGCSKAPAPKPVVPKFTPAAAAPEPVSASPERTADKPDTAGSPEVVAWPLPPLHSHLLFLGDRLVAVTEAPGLLGAWDAQGNPLWQAPGDAPIAKLLANDTGTLLAAVRSQRLELVDASNGAILGAVPLHWEDRNGKGGPWTGWQGDMLYVGIDSWSATRYEATTWHIFRTTAAGLEPMGVVPGKQQGSQVSLDGRSAVLINSVGRMELYQDGTFDRTLPVVGTIDPRGGAFLIYGQDGQLTVDDFDGNTILQVRPIPGYTVWNPWPRTDGLWHVASHPTNGGWAAYREGEIAFAGQGGVAGYYPDYLVIHNAGTTEIRDRTGALVLRINAEQVRLTLDQKWAYYQQGDQLNAFRLP